MVQVVLLPSPLTRRRRGDGCPPPSRRRGARSPSSSPRATTSRRTPSGGSRRARCRWPRSPPGPVVLVGAQRGRDAARPAGVRPAGRAPSGRGLRVRRRRGPAAGAGVTARRLRHRGPGRRRRTCAACSTPAASFPQWTRRRPGRRRPARGRPRDRRRRRCGRAALGYWIEPLPPPTDWPDAPCVYLRTSVGLRRGRCGRAQRPRLADRLPRARALPRLRRPGRRPRGSARPCSSPLVPDLAQPAHARG